MIYKGGPKFTSANTVASNPTCVILAQLSRCSKMFRLLACGGGPCPCTQLARNWSLYASRGSSPEPLSSEGGALSMRPQAPLLPMCDLQSSCPQCTGYRSKKSLPTSSPSLGHAVSSAWLSRKRGALHPRHNKSNSTPTGVRAAAGSAHWIANATPELLGQIASCHLRRMFLQTICAATRWPSRFSFLPCSFLSFLSFFLVFSLLSVFLVFSFFSVFSSFSVCFLSFFCLFFLFLPPHLSAFVCKLPDVSLICGSCLSFPPFWSTAGCSKEGFFSSRILAARLVPAYVYSFCRCFPPAFWATGGWSKEACCFLSGKKNSRKFGLKNFAPQAINTLPEWSTRVGFKFTSVNAAASNPTGVILAQLSRCSKMCSPSCLQRRPLPMRAAGPQQKAYTRARARAP